MKLIQHKLFLTSPLAALTAGSSARHGGRPAETSQSAEALPAQDLGGDTWGIACVSVASARELPDHKSEMATQILMGGVVRVWKQAGHWFHIEADDGYHAWLETESFFPGTKDDIESWNASPLLIITAFEDCIREQPLPDALPVSDVVMDCLVRKTGEDGDWFQVELPDHRVGFLPKRSATDFAGWKQSRRATPENIERAAKQFLGRPYLWGGNSPKALDCSGLTKLVFFLNGIELKRNATQQAEQGVEVPLDSGLSHLKKGDLVFFGFRAQGDRPERVTHVGIYLGDKFFIHSSQRVRISSLDSESPILDAIRNQTLLKARRVLP